MADKFVFSNFAVSTLVQSVGPTDTTFQINVDDLGRFPALVGGAKFSVVLADDDDNVEIVYAINVSTSGIVTVERAREGTLARSWLAGTLFRHVPTAASIIGAAGLRPAGIYSPGVSYSPGDIVTNNNISYIAVNAVIGVTPAIGNANWQVIYQPPGAGTGVLTLAGRWNSTTTYGNGAVVERNGRNWGSTIDGNLNSPPDYGNSNWQALGKWGGKAWYEGILQFTGTNNYAVTVAAADGPLVLYDGLTVRGKFQNSNTTNATLTITTGSTALAAVPLRPRTGVSFAAGEIRVDELYEFTYDAGQGELIAQSAPGVSQKIDLINTNIIGVPTGTILDFAGPTPPTGFLLCNGGVVSQTTYAALFAVVGSLYNVGGEGAGNFRLPDTRGRVLCGPDFGAGVMVAAAFATKIGIDAYSLLASQLPVHSHSIPALSVNGTCSANFNDVTGAYTQPLNYAGGANSLSVAISNTVVGNSISGTISGSTGASATGNTGGGLPISPVQPTLVVTKIIKT